MEDFAGFHGHTSKTCLYCSTCMLYILINECRKYLSVWRPSKAIFCLLGCKFKPKSSKIGYKVWRIFNSQRTAFLGFVKMRESSRTQIFDRTPNWTTLVIVVVEWCMYWWNGAGVGARGIGVRYIGVRDTGVWSGGVAHMVVEWRTCWSTWHWCTWHWCTTWHWCVKWWSGAHSGGMAHVALVYVALVCVTLVREVVEWRTCWST